MDPFPFKSIPCLKSSWSQASSMLYLEHPVNVGFSTGKAIISNENQIAEYIFKFLINFLKVSKWLCWTQFAWWLPSQSFMWCHYEKVKSLRIDCLSPQIFPEMNTANFYRRHFDCFISIYDKEKKMTFSLAIEIVTGESYAGMYLSYAANLIYARQSELALKLQGVLFIDPVLAPWAPFPRPYGYWSVEGGCLTSFCICYSALYSKRIFLYTLLWKWLVFMSYPDLVS
jgi:hypothetical protein